MPENARYIFKQGRCVEIRIGNHVVIADATPQAKQVWEWLGVETEWPASLVVFVVSSWRARLVHMLPEWIGPIRGRWYSFTGRLNRALGSYEGMTRFDDGIPTTICICAHSRTPVASLIHEFAHILRGPSQLRSQHHDEHFAATLRALIKRLLRHA